MENEMIVNGITYVKKEEIKKVKRERFNLQTELKLTELFLKIFSEADEQINEEYAIEKGVRVIDPANVLLCEAKTNKAKSFLCRFQSNDKPSPDLDFKDDKIATSKYSLEYLKKIIEILDATSDAIRITMKHNYPAYIENEDFKFLLAPRVDSEDE